MTQAVACQTHPTVAAIDRCAGCAEPFCGNCLVELFGQRYCGSCKVMALKGQPLPEFGNVTCKEATTAMTMAIISLFLVFCPIIGLVLAVVSFVQGQKASQLFAADPLLTGKERLRASRIIGGCSLLLSIVVLCIYVAAQGKF